MDEADKQFIKDAVYEVIEPFMARMVQDHEEMRRLMKSIDRRLDAFEQWADNHRRRDLQDRSKVTVQPMLREGVDEQHPS